MGAELVIYKNKTYICDYCGSSAFFRALNESNRIPEELSAFNPIEAFRKGIEKADELIEGIKDEIDTFTRLLYLGESTQEDKLDTIEQIKEFEKEVEEFERVKIELRFLLTSAEDDKYVYDPETNEIPIVEWTWYVSR